MRGYRRENIEARDLATNQGIVESALDELMYRPRFSANVLTPFNGALAGNTGSGAAEYLALPDAGLTPGGRFSFPVPSSFWAGGSVSLRLLWSGDTASTLGVNWAFALVKMALNTAIVSSGAIGVTVPGPAVVNGILDFTFTPATPFTVDPSTLVLGVSIFRNAGDPYVGEVRLFGFQIIYTPAAGH